MEKLFVIALLLFPSICIAGTLDLKGLVTLKCKFSLAASYSDNKIETGENPFGSEEIVFDVIDLAKGTARNIGNLGSSDIAVRLTANSLHFVDISAMGNFILTSVDLAENKNKRYDAVMSRHIMADAIVLTPIFSQNYGECRALN